ncbi:MAG: hypothetical protein AB8B50_00515 [Pirellulaceae bacterium]
MTDLMHKRQSRATVWPLRSRFLLAAVLLSGCSQLGQQGDVTVVQPEAIRMDGVEWSKAEWTDQIESRLVRYFRKAMDIASNPALSGEQVCYSSGSVQRVFWLSPIDGRCHWAMIEFKSGRGGALVEGVGDPFSKVQIVEP